MTNHPAPVWLYASKNWEEWLDGTWHYTPAILRFHSGAEHHYHLWIERDGLGLYIGYSEIQKYDNPGKSNIYRSADTPIPVCPVEETLADCQRALFAAFYESCIPNNEKPDDNN